jgi:hypothetical protein
MKYEEFEQFWVIEVKALSACLDSLKSSIDDDWKESDDDIASLQVTISCNKDCTTWAIQTGDNSYSGSCYGDPFWGVGYLTKDSDSYAVARELIDALANQIEFSN